MWSQVAFVGQTDYQTWSKGAINLTYTQKSAIHIVYVDVSLVGIVLDSSSANGISATIAMLQCAFFTWSIF